MNKDSLGKLGEELARNYLVRQGIKIIGTNVRTPFGEIDIIGEKGKKTYFIEVKTRASMSCGHPAEAITSKKKEHMVNSALYYMKGKEEPFEIGVVTIIKKEGNYEFEYFSDIF